MLLRNNHSNPNNTHTIMQKIINDPSCVVDEMLQGYVKAH